MPHTAIACSTQKNSLATPQRFGGRVDPTRPIVFNRNPVRSGTRKTTNAIFPFRIRAPG